tara:strand:- start:1786 stop:2037 length:252 start_codon:yes stop_codon:yes gene_type:complete
MVIMIENDFYYMCSKDGKVNPYSIGTWLRGLGFNPEFSHIDYYLKLIKNNSKSNDNDNITLDEFKYFMSLNHNELFYNVGKIN